MISAEMKKIFQILYLTSKQIALLVKFSIWISRFGFIGKALSLIIDNIMLTIYSIELTSRSLNIKNLVVGHSTGVVLGGNGIQCSGTLHVSSGVVFGRRYRSESTDLNSPNFFDIEGDLTVGANSVILGPIKIKGPVTLGALTLVTHDILVPGVYVGIPAKLISAN